MGVHPLPDHIVRRFAGKVIAITGYEQDQVLVDPVGQPGVHPERDVSVPINWAYNHHYMCWVTGEHSEMKEVAAEPGDTSAHGAPTKWMAVETPSAKYRTTPHDAPTSLLFSEGNGGESRKSFHGYPKGYAQLLASPRAWHLTPMQIDTRRRDCGVTRASIHNCTKFEPWMEPKQARYGRHVSQSNYSGVLECPCNSRFGGDPIFYPDAQTKSVQHKYTVLADGGTCPRGQLLPNASACFTAARHLGLADARLVNVTIHDRDRPAGCLAQLLANGSVAVGFNAAKGNTPCPSGHVRTGAATSSVNVTLSITLDPTPAGGLATIAMSGPADAWFGAGLDAMRMQDAPYTIVCNSSGAFEQQIGTCGSEAEHCAGHRLADQSLTLVSNTVVDGVRTVVVTRKFRGASVHHYTFDPTQLATLNFITAVGRTQTFAYHRAHHAAMLTMLAPTGQPTCLCDRGVVGQLCEHGGGKCTHFTKNCWAQWDGKASDGGADLLAQRNPTCNSEQYSGGLSCCGHRRVLLDHDQDPGPDLLRYHMKFRFWFEEYKEGAPVRGSYSNRPGALPRGFDALPPADNITVEAALDRCTNAADCSGITFRAADGMAGGQPTRVYFTNGTSRADGQTEWQSWVVERPVSHHHLPRFYYQTENAAGEYDVPPAFRRAGDPPIPGYPNLPISTTKPGDLHLTPGTTCTGTCPAGPDCDCVHTITAHWTMSNARMLYAGGHCHAPSCISIELFRNDTGTPKLVCRQTSHYGVGDVSRDRFDEAGYIVLPPCLWGSEEEGLEPPVWLPPNTPMVSIKKNRNTHAGHYGEMASWQMRGVNFPAV